MVTDLFSYLPTTNIHPKCSDLPNFNSHGTFWNIGSKRTKTLILPLPHPFFTSDTVTVSAPDNPELFARTFAASYTLDSACALYRLPGVEAELGHF